MFLNQNRLEYEFEDAVVTNSNKISEKSHIILFGVHTMRKTTGGGAFLC